MRNHQLAELAPLRQACLDSHAWPVVPVAALRLCEALVHLGAVRSDLALPGHLAADYAGTHREKASAELSIAAALLVAHCPGVRILRRKNPAASGRRLFLYWIDLGDRLPAGTPASHAVAAVAA